MTISGVRWETIGQSEFTKKRLYLFASLDQFASTTGIPAGMLLFGFAGLIDKAAFMYDNIACMTTLLGGIAFLFTMPCLIHFLLKDDKLKDDKTKKTQLDLTMRLPSFH